MRDGDTVATGGFVGIGFAENLAVALEERFVDSAKDDPQRHRPPARPDAGLRRRPGRRQGARAQPLRPPGHASSASSAATGAWCRSCRRSRSANQIEAYNLPQGVITHLFRDIAAGKPGHLSRVGLGTFVDPASRRRQDQRAHDRGSGRADRRSAARSTCSTRPSRSTSPSSAAPPPTPTATSRWSARR